MKVKLIIIMIISTIFSCQKEPGSKNIISNSDILGTWINNSNTQDTIQIMDTIIFRWYPEVNCYCHSYIYQIKTDSIIISSSIFDVVVSSFYFCLINKISFSLSGNNSDSIVTHIISSFIW